MSDPCAIIRIYRKGGSMSFLENENQMVVDVEIKEISEQLFEEWHNSNLDEEHFMLIGELQVCHLAIISKVDLINSMI